MNCNKLEFANFRIFIKTGPVFTGETGIDFRFYQKKIHDSFSDAMEILFNNPDFFTEADRPPVHHTGDQAGREAD